MRGVERWTKWLSAASLAALVCGCAGVPRDASLPIVDPNEQFNRGVLHLNQVVLDPPATVVKSVPGVIRDRFQDLDANLKEPRVFANNILQGRFNAAGITDRPHRHKHHIRPWRIVRRRRDGGQLAAADRRFRPDHVRLWRPRRLLYRFPIFRSLDATRCDRRHRGFGRRPRRLGCGRDFLWMAVVNRHRRPGRCRSPRPMETGREFVGRFLQFPALELLSDAPGAIARGDWPAAAD